MSDDNRPLPGLWTAKPLRRRFEPLRLAPLAGSLPLLWLLWSFLTRGLVATNSLVVCLTQLICVSFLLLMHYVKEAILQRSSINDRALRDRTDDVLEFSVVLNICMRSGTKPLVLHDRGVVYFQEGRIGFTGLACSFILGPQDLKPIVDWNYSDTTLRAQLLGLKTGSEGDCLQIMPVWGEKQAYSKALRAFLIGKDRSTEPRQWPPLEPYTNQSLSKETA